MALRQVKDTPTNNFATLNPLDAGTNLSFTNGNLRLSSSSNPNNNTKGTIGVSAGKWYFEYVIVSGNNSSVVGIGGQSASVSSNFSGDLYAYDSNGNKVNEGYEYLGYNITNNQAEYSGLINGLKYANQAQLSPLYIKGDSTLIMKVLNVAA